MGTVWRAEQHEPVQRQVALKIIKLGMDTTRGGGALRRRAPGSRHDGSPRHRTKVHDAGTTASGRPFFVMELVEGVPLNEFCDREQLDPAKRLELFARVCRAVQHAHQKGVVHRDLKPSNILVVPGDGEPTVKIIDFGIAKAVEEKLTEETLRTRLGRIVGTLGYMSPEQGRRGSGRRYRRSDVYSLGGGSLRAALRPPPPSRKPACRSAAVRRCPQDDPGRWIRPSRAPDSVRSARREARSPASAPPSCAASSARCAATSTGVVMARPVEKDRERRYETANALALDVERFLRDEAVTAGPPSATYRLRKFVRRNRAGVAFAATVLILLVAGIIATTTYALTEGEARRGGRHRFGRGGPRSGSRGQA